MAQFTTGMMVYGCDVVGTATGPTAIFTAPQGFVVSQIQVVLTNSSGVITGPIISIGSNASSYNNINTLSAFGGLSILNGVVNLASNSPGYHLQTNDTVYIDVKTAAIATTYNFQVLLLGYPL